MNGKAWTVNPLLVVGLLLLALGVPRTLDADDRKSDDPCTPKRLDFHNANKKHDMSPEARLLPDPPDQDSFKADPCYPPAYDSVAELQIYSGKHMIDRPQPPIQLGLRVYDYGAYTPRPTWLGTDNPIGFHFMTFGDLRIAAATNDNGIVGSNGKTQQTSIAARLNLDMDAQFTATERIHALVRPLDKNGTFTSFQFGNGVPDRLIHPFNFDLKTLFFEGDLAAMAQGLSGKTNPYDLPIALGRVPINTQNGIWIDDAFDGGAFSITARNIPSLDVSNTDLTVFAGFNKVTTAADPGDKAGVFGLAGFADVLRGYLEYGYGYLDANVSGHRYHNVTAAFSKRYRGRIANSVRVIGNFGQKGVAGVKTADGVLVLVENSLVPRRHFVWSTVNPLNFVPYFNFFAGFKNPQSLARAADAGGVLKNTGINFETDGVTGYPTLDANAHDTYGGAAGLEYLFTDLNHQIVVEGAVVERRSNSNVPGNEYAFGARYQHPFTKTWILRLDAMHGWRQGQRDISGVRVEIRRKF
jgi:hypothetical protein